MLQSHGLLQEGNHQPEGSLTVRVYLSIKPLVISLDFKIILLVNKALNSLRHKYVSDLLACYKSSRPLRLDGTGLLSVPRVKTKRGEEAVGFYACHLMTKLSDYWM